MARTRCTGLCLRSESTAALPAPSSPDAHTVSYGSAAVSGRSGPSPLDKVACGVSQPERTLPSKAACASGLLSSAVERAVGGDHANAAGAAAAAATSVTATAEKVLNIAFQAGRRT